MDIRQKENKLKLEAVRIKILSREIVKKRKERVGLAEENLPHSWDGGGGAHLREQHPQGGGGEGEGAVHILKSKIEIKQQENADIFVTNIQKYKQKLNVKQLVDKFEVEERRTRNRDTGAVVEEQSGLSSPYKRLKMPELRPPPNAHSMPGPRTMRSSSSCPSTLPRTRSSPCARPRKRGPLPPSSLSVAYAIPPPAAETNLNLGIVNTVSRWTACTARSMGMWPPTSSTSLTSSGTSGSKEEHPRIHLPPANPSARPFGKGTCSASSSSSKCLDSEKRKRLKSIPESMGDMQSSTSSSSPSLACKKRQAGDDPARKILSSSFSPSPKPEEAEDKQEERKSRKEKIRKIQIQEDSITSLERIDYFAVENVETNLRKPGLEAAPGTTGPPPSRACSSPGSSSPSGVMTPSPRCSRTGDKGGRGTLYGNGRKSDNGALHVEKLSTTAATNCGQPSVARGEGRRQREF